MKEKGINSKVIINYLSFQNLNTNLNFIKIKQIKMQNTINGLPVQIRHSRFTKKKGTRITLAMMYNPENTIASFGIAKCFSKDNFCKKIGRTLAIGRLDLGNKPIYSISVKPEQDLKELFNSEFQRMETFMKSHGLKDLAESLKPKKVKEPSFKMEEKSN